MDWAPVPRLSINPGLLPRYQLHPSERIAGVKQAYISAAANARPRNLPDRAEMMQIFAIRLRDGAREVDFKREG